MQTRRVAKNYGELRATSDGPWGILKPLPDERLEPAEKAHSPVAARQAAPGGTEQQRNGICTGYSRDEADSIRAPSNRGCAAAGAVRMQA